MALAVESTGEGIGAGVFKAYACHINVVNQHIVACGLCCHSCGEYSQICSRSDQHGIKVDIDACIQCLASGGKGQSNRLLTFQCLNSCTVQRYYAVSIACRGKGGAVYRCAGQAVASQCAAVVAQIDGKVSICAVSAGLKAVADHQSFLARYIAFRCIEVIRSIGKHSLQRVAAGVLTVHTGDVVHGAVADTQTVSTVGNHNLNLGVHSLRIQIRHFYIDHFVICPSFTGFAVTGIGVASASGNIEVETQSDLAAENHTDTVKAYAAQLVGYIRGRNFLRNYLIAFQLAAGIGRIAGIDTEVALCRCTVVQHPLNQALQLLGVLTCQNGIGIVPNGRGFLQNGLATGNQGQLHLGSHLGCAQGHREYIAIVSCGHFADRKGPIALTVYCNGHYAVSGVLACDICIETHGQVFA